MNGCFYLLRGSPQNDNILIYKGLFLSFTISLFWLSSSFIHHPLRILTLTSDGGVLYRHTEEELPELLIRLLIWHPEMQSVR